MNNYDLDDALVQFVNDPLVSPWTLRHAFEGVQIFGGIGSGKTSGSGRTIAMKYLKYGFGGLVLTVKHDEVDTWKEYCEAAGRIDDLLILEPSGKYNFNFLTYVSESVGKKEALTENVVEVLKTVIKASQEKDGGGNDNAFWETALDMLMFNVIDLCKLAYGQITVQLLYDIANTLPQMELTTKTPEQKEADSKKATPFKTAHALAVANVEKELKQWHKDLSEEYKEKLKKTGSIKQAYLSDLANARLLNTLNQFFFITLKNLNDKTRSIIDFMFSGFLFRLLREPIYSTFCKNTSNIAPENSLNGKIIVLNMPVKIYNKVGRDCQILFKYIWQRTMEKRRTKDNNRPVFLWADEAQNFIHEHDADYQATTRSSRVSTVYLTQNLPNYLAALDGKRGEYKVKSFIGTLGTKIFHANSDLDTNIYSSNLVGEKEYERTQQGMSGGEENTGYSVNRTSAFEKVMRPEDFVGLKNGGKKNKEIVQGLVHVQGSSIFANDNFYIVKFLQDRTANI